MLESVDRGVDRLSHFDHIFHFLTDDLGLVIGNYAGDHTERPEDSEAHTEF